MARNQLPNCHPERALKGDEGSFRLQNLITERFLTPFEMTTRQQKTMERWPSG